MMLLAPGLLSITTGWPNCFCRPTVSRRAIWSVKPPAVYGTTMRMGRLGQPDCASAERGRGQRSACGLHDAAAGKG